MVKYSKKLMKDIKRQLIEAMAGETDDEIVALHEFWVAEGNSFSR